MVLGDADSFSNKLHKTDEDAIKPNVPHEWGL